MDLRFDLAVLDFERPETLHPGWSYFHRSAAHPSAYRKVRFIGYTPCAAVVMIAAEDNPVERVLRSEIFLPGRQPA